MRLVACVILFASLCLSATGCASFGKKSNAGDRGSAGSDAARSKPAPRTAPQNTNDPILGGSSAAPPPPPPQQAVMTASTTGAILAGRVIDTLDHAPNNAFVRLVAMDDKDAGNPTEVAVNPEGYFTIQGLKPGTQYKLIARAKNGERMMAGITYTAAPNIRVLIQVREGFSTPDTPPLPGAPTPGAKDPAPQQPAKTGNEMSRGGWSPVHGSPGNAQSTQNAPAVGRVGVEPNLPVQMKVPGPQQSAAIPSNQTWTPALGDPSRAWPPALEIPAQRPKPNIEIQKPLPVPGGEPPPPMFPGASNAAPVPSASNARVPSCVLVGKQLVNFALHDVNGETFEFRTSKRGKVVLLDFWATYCMPCQKTIPQLRNLQTRYGSQGLEVIGVAYETGGTIQEQAQRVNTVAQRLQVNYRQLLGTGSQCPIKSQLSIHYVPTLVLVDENGWILWRHEGQPDRPTLDELERRIQQALTNRPS